MREILTRGKRENGDWVYGYAVKKAYHNGYYIITHFFRDFDKKVYITDA